MLNIQSLSFIGYLTPLPIKSIIYVVNSCNFVVKKPFFYHFYHASITPSITIQLSISKIVNMVCDRSDRRK